MNPFIEMVMQFHEAYDCDINHTPALDDEKLNQLRLALIREELDELDEALTLRDPIAALDALCDLQYVISGAFISLGFYSVADEAMDEVHRSNLSKLDEHGRPIKDYTGKVVKGPLFSEPDLERILYAHFER